ncbi:MAG: hypothetical protein EPN88_08820 [Bacteroidetes bacterium]|nr:MAG: hypothetical protein EPN88_08820 [Bacteroidota bacterium]
MKTRTLFLFFALSMMLPVTSNGQVGNLLKNKLNRVVNAGTKTVDKEVNNQIDTAVNKGADNAKNKGATRVENNKQKEGQPSQTGDGGSEGQSGAGFGKLFGNKIDLKYKEEYAFTSRIYMVTETYDKKDVVKMDFFMYYSSSTPSVGVETKTISDEKGEVTPVTAVMVMDGENKSFIMLTDVNGMKMGIISAVPDENTAQTQSGGKQKKNSTPPTFTKTGNTREIAGYKCDEYSYVDTEDKTSGKVWFTKDANLKIDKRGWNNSGMAAYYGNPVFNDGIILANETYDEKGKLTMKSETKEINPNFPHSISVTGYTLRQMKLGQNEKK